MFAAKPIALCAAGLAVLSLAACGGGGTSTANGASADASGASAMPANWKASDACTIVDKSAMSEALQTDVTEASLGLAHEAEGPNAATSECSYILKDGGRASVMTRWSPIADNTPEAIATAKSTTEATAKAFNKTVEDVPGLGKGAFFVPGINQLNVFLDDSRMIMITLPGGAEAKDRAIALARKSVG